MSSRPLVPAGRVLRSGLVTAALGALATLPAHASGALEINGAPTSSNGLTTRALGRHAETAYFNPALLTRTGPLIEVGYFVLHTHGDIRLEDRPESADIQDTVYDAEIREPDGTTARLQLRPLATDDLPSQRRNTLTRDTSSYALVGIARPLFDDALTFGLFAIMPTRGVLAQDGFFSDEREQFFSNQLDFEMLGDRSGVTSFALAVGGESRTVAQRRSRSEPGAEHYDRFEVYVPDAADQRSILLNPDMTTSASFAPHLGIALRPSRELTMTATLHTPTSADVSGENLLRFWNYTYPDDEDFVRQTYIFSQSFQPLRVGIGAAWSHRRQAAGVSAWELGAQAVLRRWSQYQDRHGEHPEDTFENTIEVGIGGALTSSVGLFSLDVGFVPSPVPDQIGRSNHVNNDRITTQTTWEMPLEVLGSAASVGVYLQGQLLVPRDVEKRSDAAHPVLDEFPDGSTDFVTGEPLADAVGLQTNNPGYPGYRSTGWMVGAGLAFRLPN